MCIPAAGEKVLLTLYPQFHMLLVVCFLVWTLISYYELIAMCPCVWVSCAMKLWLHHSAGPGQVFYVHFLAKDFHVKGVSLIKWDIHFGSS